jgi:hypothetical protein
MLWKKGVKGIQRVQEIDGDTENECIFENCEYHSQKPVQPPQHDKFNDSGESFSN